MEKSIVKNISIYLVIFPLIILMNLIFNSKDIIL